MTGADTNFSLVEEGVEYALFSTQDEAAYRLHNKAENMMAYLQDDDATRFQDDYKTIKQQYPDWAADQTLAQLWDQGGYGWLAEGTA
jgi:hypothetical protein